MDNEVLISEVHKRNPLWDTSCNDYCKRDLLKRLWGEVANILHCDKEIVKRRWKNLRDNYRTELKKFKEKGHGTKWIYFESMNFLQDIMETRYIEENQSNNDNDPYSCQFLETKFNDTPSNDDSSSQAQASTTYFTKATSKRKRNAEEDEHDRIVECDKITSSDLDDSDYNFLISLTPHLQSLSQINKLKFRMEAAKMLMQLKQHDEESQTKISTTGSWNTRMSRETANDINIKQSPTSSPDNRYSDDLEHEYQKLPVITTSNKNDAYDTFGTFVANELRAVGSNTSLVRSVKRKIQVALLETYETETINASIGNTNMQSEVDLPQPVQLSCPPSIVIKTEHYQEDTDSIS